MESRGLFALVLAGFLAGCGGSSTTNSGPPRLPPAAIRVVISPSDVTVSANAIQTFVAEVIGAVDRAVSWEVQEPSGGTVENPGLYSAPAVGGTFHVVARSVANPASFATAAVTVTAAAPYPQAVAVSVSPTAFTVAPGGIEQLRATVTGASEPSVRWTVADPLSGGSVDASGLYTAPFAGGTYLITATSVADPAATATALATIQSGAVSVLVVPASMTLAAGQTATFSANVAGTSNPQVAWSVDEAAGGIVDANGAYVAPAVAGLFHVRATSITDPARSGMATVAVNAPAPPIDIFPLTANIGPGVTIQFSATLNESLPDRFVHWAVKEGDAGGTIDGLGFYTAPGTSGTYHVTVSADATFSMAVATVNVDATNVSVIIDRPVISRELDSGTLDVMYHATVSNAADQRVSWTVREGVAGGSVDSTGAYTPPLRPGTFHVVATSRADPTRQAIATYFLYAGPGMGPNLVDRGGPVLPKAKIIPIFWGPPAEFPIDAVASIQSLLQSLQGSAYLDIVAQYVRGEALSVSYGGALFDRTPGPQTEPRAPEIAAAACASLDAAGIPPDPSTVHLVFTSTFPPSTDQYCAWHSIGPCHGIQIPIAYLPNPTGTFCMGGAPSSSKISAATAKLEMNTAHELLETVVGPVDGWLDPTGNEVADKCAIYVEFMQLAGGTFWLPSLWSNADERCVR